MLIRIPMTMLLALLVTPIAARAQTTQPSDRAALEIRANEEFARGAWDKALPLLQKLAVQNKNDAQKVGPILEKIRVCEKNLGTAGLAQLNGAPPTGEQRVAHGAPRPGQVMEMTIKDLGNFEYDPDQGGNIPDDVTRLSGTKVRLNGFMIPMDQAENITQFALVPSLFACCFGQPPQIQHTVVVNCPKGKAVAYYPDEIIVEGTLKVEEKKDEGFIVSIFEMEVDSVKPSAR